MIGKNTGDDFRERKLTLPVILAVAAASPEERAFWVRVIEKGDQRPEDLAEAMVILSRHGALAAARDVAMHWAERARQALCNLKESDLKDALSELADFVVKRVS